MRATFLLLALAAAPAACSSTSTASTTVAIPSGVVVHAEALVGNAGCGAGAGQVFKYGVTVTATADGGDQNVAGGMYDCFADAKFSDLPPSADGQPIPYTLHVYAFDETAYTAQNAGGALDHSVQDWGTLQKFTPTYATTCKATWLPVLEVVEVVAVCPPLIAGPATSIAIDTSRFAFGSSTTLSCDQDYNSVTTTFDGSDGTSGALPAVKCPAPVVLSPAKPNVSYTFALTLPYPTGLAKWTAHCHATAALGQQIAAACDPIQ